MLMRRGQALAVVTVLGSLLLLLRDVKCGYQPQYERDIQIMFGDGAYRYPDGDDVATNPNYFISEMNFDLIENTVVMGAANQLLFLSTADFSPLHVYEWPATAENLNLCRNPESKGMAGSVSTLENPDYICNNHIRVYRRLPSNSSLVLVCGTQAVIDPQCRILEVSVSEDGVSVKAHSPVSASDGLISYFPQFSQFGEFRGSDDSDPVYLSAGFFTGGNTGVARHFSISYQNITLTTPSDPNTLETTELFRTINANNNWLRFPVTFVGSYRADYSPTDPAERNSDYQFWFLLLRENLVTDEVIYSRLVRICRNDPGSQLTSGGAKYFTTFMKARIFCERKKPSSLEFTATLDYIYNSITSFVFSSGRYYGNDSPQRLLYGSFTGPNNGPVGSALCVYPADNSLEAAPQSTGRSGSVFDIFRDDISETSDGTSPVENAFVECAAEGRQEQDQQLLFSTKSVDQIGDDPILVLDDFIVTQMVQDSVCVVTRDDPSTCVNQDILFLGLDSGRVLKVVFRTDENGDSDPVVVENIELDPDDVRNVTAMELREISNEKFLFVATETRVYKLPLQRCSDFSSCNCSECVASRDPYCVYNKENRTCEENTLTSSEPVHSRYRQDIHRGTVEESCDCPVVTLRPINPVVYESEGSVTFIITATREVSIEFQTIRGSADARDFTVMTQTVNVSLEASVTVPITDDTAFEPEQQFSVSLSADVGVVFINDLAIVTILDDDGDEGVSFQVKFLTGVDCKDTVAIDDHFMSQLREALVSGVHDNCQDCDDFTSENIIKPRLLATCDGMWSVTLEGEMLSTENAPVSTSLLPALSKWILQNSTVTVDQLTLTANCIDSTPETTCKSAVVTLRPINPVVYENEGSVTFNISATREVSIEFQTIRGSADDRDFTVMSQTVNVSLEASVTVPITDDTAFEPEQQFSVSLSADVGVVFINDLAIVTILDDDGDEGVSFQVTFLTGVDCKDTVAIDDHFMFQLREALVSGVHDNCQDCDDFTSENIIKPRLLATCDGMWSVTLEGEMLSTENAPVSTSLLPALSKWVSQNSTVTVGQLTLTANCIDSTPETKSALDMYCVPPTSGVLPSKDDNYLSAFVAFLVLFIITVAIAGVLSIFLIVLLCNRHKPGSNIFCIGSPESKSSTLKAGVPNDCIDGYYTTPGEELQTTAPPTAVSQTTAPPTAVPQTRANPPLRHQPVSYVAAQDHSVLPTASPLSRETGLSTLHEGQGETHPGSGDCEMSGNTAYGMRNDVNGDGVMGEGVQPVDYEIPPNTAYGIKRGVNGEGVGVMGVGVTVVPLH